MVNLFRFVDRMMSLPQELEQQLRTEVIRYREERMKLIKLNCSACGAPISIPDNLEKLTCANCGTFLVVEHGEGYYALQAADQISDAIHESGRGTQDAIKQGAE